MKHQIHALHRTHRRLSMSSRQITARDDWPTTHARSGRFAGARPPRQPTARHGSRTGAGPRPVPAPPSQLPSYAFSLGPARRSAPAAGV
jgi:hypothetical protein